MTQLITAVIHPRITYRLFRYYTKSGMTFANAIHLATTRGLK